MSEVQLQIPQPPDFLFKKERTGHLLNEKSPIYLIERMEAVEDFGMCTYFQNVPYARKGFVTPEAVYAINQIKKILLEGSKLLKNPFTLLGIVTTNKTKLCQSFNVVFDKVFGRHKMKDEFMCRASFNFANFVHGVLMDMGVEHDVAKEFGFNLAQIIEYDDAYRYRLQDLMGELDLDAFNKSHRKETKRLIKIFRERSDNFVPDKFTAIFNVLLLLPLKLTKHSAFLKEIQPDKHDRYWMCLRDDHYDYFNLSTKARHALYTERPITYEATA